MRAPQFEAYRCLCFERGPILYPSRGCRSRASQGGFGLWDVFGGFSHIMRCGPLAGHSQQGTADLNINTVRP